MSTIAHLGIDLLISNIINLTLLCRSSGGDIRISATDGRAVLDSVRVQCNQVYWTLTMRVQHIEFTSHCLSGFHSEVTAMALLQLGTSKCSTMTESISSLQSINSRWCDCIGFLRADREIFRCGRPLLLSISLGNGCSVVPVRNLQTSRMSCAQEKVLYRLNDSQKVGWYRFRPVRQRVHLDRMKNGWRLRDGINI